MCQCGTVSLLLLLLTGVPILIAQDSSTTDSTKASEGTTSSEVIEEFDPSNAYCFEFTWLGPSYDKTVSFESTCEDFVSEKNIVEHGLCRQPFVITNDSTLPDLQYLWRHSSYKPRVLRRKRKGEVCVRYTYFFNDEVMNITYLRSKVFAEDEGAVTSGCYTQEHNGIASELCVCEPRVGDYFPCNTAPAASTLINGAIVALACMLTRWLI
ncbi:uncharacterized protein [Atheta coriaria]|uniref:uncharacterized protein n=1 Tax=Dalotia coriaria TaxID=877792 RepID=UPI0031F41E46